MTEHLKVPGNYKQLFVKDKKEKRLFFWNRENTTKEYHCIIPGKYVNLYHNIYLICQGALSLPSIIIQNTSISHAKKQIFNKAPNLVSPPDFALSRTPQIPSQNTPKNTFFTKQLPVAAFPNASYFFRKAKPETIFPTSSALDTIEIL